MSTTVEKIASNKVKLSFDIDSAKFDEAMGKAYLKVRNQVSIPGFRKGKAPRKMIENMYGEGVFYDEAFELIFDEVYGPAVEENKVEVVDRPEIEIQEIGAGKNLKFTCEVFVKPDVVLGDYKGVAVKKETTLVTDEEVDARIQQERGDLYLEYAPQQDFLMQLWRIKNRLDSASKQLNRPEKNITREELMRNPYEQMEEP